MKEIIAQLRNVKVILIGVGGLLVLCLIFQLGLMVGYKKASFSYRWGENYHRNFGGPRGGFMNMMRDDDFIEGHGVFGKIMTINGSALTIKGQYDREISVVVTNATVIKQFQKTVTVKDLHVDDSVVIIGEPKDSGQIEAKFIRIMPRSSEKKDTPSAMRKIEWRKI